jgi:hypothetical protein
MDRVARVEKTRKLRKANGGMYFSYLGGSGTESSWSGRSDRVRHVLFTTPIDRERIDWKSAQVARRVHCVNARTLRVTGVLLAVAWVFAQASTPTKNFALYQMDKSCFCINTKKETKSVAAIEKRIGKSAYQVFWSRTEPKQELFRVEIGTYVGKGAEKWWNYGIADEGDFNGDGTPDYSWYGGDDTGFAMYLFLSSGSTYKRIDILKTVQAAWIRRYHTAAPDLGGSGEGYALGDVVLERSTTGIVLLAEIHFETFDGVKKETRQFRIKQSDFKQ